MLLSPGRGSEELWENESWESGGGVAGRPPSTLFWIMIDFSCRSLHRSLTSEHWLTHFLSPSLPASFLPLPPLRPPSLCLPPSSLFTTNISSKHNNRGHQPVATRQLLEQQRCWAETLDGWVCVCVCDDRLAVKASSKKTNKQRRNKCSRWGQTLNQGSSSFSGPQCYFLNFSTPANRLSPVL